MAKILFDISDKETAIDWLRCHLLVDVSAHFFSYAVLNKNKKVLHIQVYELHSENNRDLIEELEEIITTEDIFKHNVKQRIVVYNFPESHLLPEEYFQDNINKDFLELLHGDLHTGVVLSDKIQNTKQCNVFRIPTDIHDLFLRSFANAKYKHYYSLWAQWDQKKMMLTDDAYLSVIIHPRRILVMAVKNKQVQLINSYNYDTVEDVAYYLLAICQQLKLPLHNTTIKLSGMIDESSSLYAEAFKYFRKLEMEAFPAPLYATFFQEYPSHFFSPLLKLAICV